MSDAVPLGSDPLPEAAFPYELVREGVLMAPDPSDPLEAEGVLNPAAGRGPDGELYLLPRLVSAGNISRVGLAEVSVAGLGDTARGRARGGAILGAWRQQRRGGGPADTWIAGLQLYVMTYVAFGPLGSRTAIATSTDLRRWDRLGPVLFRWDADVEVDLNLAYDKDTSFFPEPVTSPHGELSLAVLHRPMGHLKAFSATDLSVGTPGPLDPRQSIWISFLPLEAVLSDRRALTLWQSTGCSPDQSMPGRSSRSVAVRLRSGSQKGGCCCTTG